MKFVFIYLYNLHIIRNKESTDLLYFLHVFWLHTQPPDAAIHYMVTNIGSVISYLSWRQQQSTLPHSGSAHLQLYCRQSLHLQEQELWQQAGVLQGASQTGLQYGP